MMERPLFQASITPLLWGWGWNDCSEFVIDRFKSDPHHPPARRHRPCARDTHGAVHAPAARRRLPTQRIYTRLRARWRMWRDEDGDRSQRRRTHSHICTMGRGGGTGAYTASGFGARRLKIPILWGADHRVVEGAQLPAVVECWRGWVRVSDEDGGGVRLECVWSVSAQARCHLEDLSRCRGVRVLRPQPCNRGAGDDGVGRTEASSGVVWCGAVRC
ncbi:hypothetical protein B0H19DRAFT_525097 [Mycena capillaripes]|nr:hypothetical protein B0H19DRAFT_525097 [Mycena capillaripes]